MKEVFKEIVAGIPPVARYGFFFVLGLCICGIIWLSSCSTVREVMKACPPDSYVEEILESVIESRLDVPYGSIDLTPDSPEE